MVSHISNSPVVLQVLKYPHFPVLQNTRNVMLGKYCAKEQLRFPTLLSCPPVVFITFMYDDPTCNNINNTFIHITLKFSTIISLKCSYHFIVFDFQ